MVSERTGIPRTAARRHLLSLCHFGYAQTDGKFFWLAPRVLRLGQSYLGAARLPRLVQPFIQRLSMATGETVNVSVLDGHEVVYVARSNSPRLVSIGFHSVTARRRTRSRPAWCCCRACPTTWRSAGCRRTSSPASAPSPSPTASLHGPGAPPRGAPATGSRSSSSTPRWRRGLPLIDRHGMQGGPEHDAAGAELAGCGVEAKLVPALRETALTLIPLL